MSAPLRVLHVGTGFRPYRRGGLVAYVEDLIDEQSRRGHDLAYLFAGRHYPVSRGPRLRRWERRGVPMLEIVDSPIHDHGRQPGLEVSERRLERIVERVVRERRPDVVHVHELAGFPSSVLDVARCTGAQVLFTLQDYFAVCPNFKLRDHEGRTCLRLEVGESCVRTIAQRPRDPALLFEATLHHDLHARWPHLPERVRRKLMREVPALLRLAGRRAAPGRGDAVAYQRRREINVERLNRVDRLIAMSGRVAELHAALGVDEQRLETMQLTLSHIEHLRPRPPREPGAPLTFATLGGGESEEKGAGVLLAAWRALAARPGGPGGRLLLFGHVAPEIAADAATIPGVEVRPPYRPDQLDAILEEVDVGIMPSVWEEAYGYAGVEFLAKGIPVAANAIGGVTDYVRDGETGWLNPACTSEGLEAILAAVVKDPAQAERLGERIRRDRDRLIMPMARHADELEALYRRR